MLTGIIERNKKHPAATHFETQIRFERNAKELCRVDVVEYGSGVLQFILPLKTMTFDTGELVELFFDLPVTGPTKVGAEIVQLRGGVDLDLERIFHYGLKLKNVSPEVWNFILYYLEEAISRDDNKPAFEQERKDFRLTGLNLSAEIAIDSGRPLKAWIIDISYGGAKVRTLEPVPVESEVLLSIVNPEAKINVKGSCVWSNENEIRTGFYNGIVFEPLDYETFYQMRTLVFRLDSADN